MSYTCFSRKLSGKQIFSRPFPKNKYFKQFSQTSAKLSWRHNIFTKQVLSFSRKFLRNVRTFSQANFHEIAKMIFAKREQKYSCQAYHCPTSPVTLPSRSYCLPLSLFLHPWGYSILADHIAPSCMSPNPKGEGDGSGGLSQ
jgi:hypothetical protein